MRILVDMSGGVDSTYTAMRLIDEGHEVHGAVLVMHEHTDVDSAKEAAEKLGIPLYVIDCREEFDREVRENFISEYLKARTPNPCVICNPRVKFLKLFEYALANGFDKIATGHYARITERQYPGGRIKHIAMARDRSKDQSYMLYRLPREITDILLLPMGEEIKFEIRRELQSSEYRELDKKDSQEICFIPDGDYASYIEKERGCVPHGSFIDKSGKVLGEHQGIIRYTIGQRKGLGISLGARAFVSGIDPIANTVTLGDEPPMSDTILLDNVFFTAPEQDKLINREVLVKVRYASRPTHARININEDGGVTVYLPSPERSVTPGQSCVIYDGDTVLGGGIIASASLASEL